MTNKRDNTEQSTIIAPDQDFQKMVENNVAEAWFEYCRRHGIDQSIDKEEKS